MMFVNIFHKNTQICQINQIFILILLNSTAQRYEGIKYKLDS